MTVDVIVPVYNAQDTLAESVNSICGQSYRDIQIVLVNDGSTDGSPDLCGALMKADPRISLSHIEHQGAAAARNTGIGVSHGVFVAFVDADDYLAPNAIELLVNAMYGVDMVAGSFRKFGEFEQMVTHETKVLGPPELANYVMGNLRNPRTNQMMAGCWAKLYRRALVQPFPDLTTAEDQAFNFDYLTRCRRVRFIDEVVYNNRKHPGSLSTMFDEKDRLGLFGFLDGLKRVKRFLLEFYPADELEDALDASKIYHSALYAMRISGLSPQAIKETLRKMYGDQ